MVDMAQILENYMCVLKDVICGSKYSFEQGNNSYLLVLVTY